MMYKSDNELLISVTSGGDISALSLVDGFGNIKLIEFISVESWERNNEELKKIIEQYPEVFDKLKQRSFTVVPYEYLEGKRKSKTYAVNVYGGPNPLAEKAANKEDRTLIFKRYDVITFEDDEKVVVLAALMFEGDEYVYVQGVLPDESDVLDSYKIMVVLEEEGALQKETDPWILSQLAPRFRAMLENKFEL